MENMAYTTALVVFCAFANVWQAVDMFGVPISSYKLIIKQLESCADEGTGQMHFGNKIRRGDDGEHIYNSTIHFGYDIDKFTKVHIEIQKKGNGGYKPHFVDYTANNCEELWLHAKDVFTSLLKSAGVNITKCPIPKGNYTTFKFNMNEVKFNNFPAFPYSSYRPILTFYYKGVKVGCIAMYTDVVPPSLV